MSVKTIALDDAAVRLQELVALDRVELLPSMLETRTNPSPQGNGSPSIQGAPAAMSWRTSSESPAW